MLLISRDVFNLVWFFFLVITNALEVSANQNVMHKRCNSYLFLIYVCLLFVSFIAMYWKDSIVMMDNPYHIYTFIFYLKTLGRPLNVELKFYGSSVTDRCFCSSPRIYLGEFYTHVILVFTSLIDRIAFLIH